MITLSIFFDGWRIFGLVSGLLSTFLIWLFEFRYRLCHFFVIFCLFTLLISDFEMGKFKLISGILRDSLAALSAFSLPYIPTWAGIHKKVICFPALVRSLALLSI